MLFPWLLSYGESDVGITYRPHSQNSPQFTSCSVIAVDIRGRSLVVGTQVGP